MFTTDGAVPSFYAERGMIGGCLRIATDLGVEPMRALQMATIDPATFLGLDEELGGVAPGRRATLQRPARDRRVAAGAGARRRREVVARDGALIGALPGRSTGPPGRALVAPPPRPSRR